MVHRIIIMHDRDERGGVGATGSAEAGVSGRHSQLLDEAAEEVWRVGPRVFRAVKTHVARTMRAPEDIKEIGDSQIMVLHLLNKGSYMTSELARMQNVTMPTMTRIVDQLVDKGYVERRQDPEDRRCIFLKLTGDGKEISLQVEEQIKEELRRFLSPLSEEQLEDIKRAHKHLASLLREYHTEADANKSGKTPLTSAQEQDKSQLATAN